LEERKMQDGQYAVLDSQYAATDKHQNQGWIFFLSNTKEIQLFCCQTKFY